MIEYTKQFQVYRPDGDHLGRIKPGSLLRYAQQMATEHAEKLGMTNDLYVQTHTAYVLAKLALHVERLPRVDEVLTLVTQPENVKRAVNKRITHFYDESGAEVAMVDSRWVLIDTDRRVILRKHPESFSVSWSEDIPYELPMRMQKAGAEDCEPAGEYAALYSRCDMNGHLNNTRYVDIICDALPWEIWETSSLKDLIVFYHREVPRGENFSLRRARTAEGQWYFYGERNGLSAFEASMTFSRN